METTEGYAPIDQFNTSEQLAYQPEVTSEIQLSSENADAYVSDITATLNRHGFLPDRNRIDAHDAYVKDPEFASELRELGALLIDAREYSRVDQRLETAQDLQRRGVGDRHLLSEQIHQDLSLIVEFDHQLREWLTEHGNDLQVSQVTEWLYSASGDSDWASKRVRGIAGEIAVGRKMAEEALTDSPIKEVFYTTKEDDIRGMDLVAVLETGPGQFQEVGIDVKTVTGGLTYQESFVENTKRVDGKPVYTISIASNEIGKGFITEPNALRYQLEQLGKAQHVTIETEQESTPIVPKARHAKTLHKRRAA